MIRVLLVVAGVSGCDPCAGPDYLSFETVRPNHSSAPRWGASETMAPTDAIRILVSEGVSIPLDVLELVAADGESVTFRGEDVFAPTTDEACAHAERRYSLADLSVGDYTLVHRRASGTGDPINCVGACPWTTFAAGADAGARGSLMLSAPLIVGFTFAAIVAFIMLRKTRAFWVPSVALIAYAIGVHVLLPWHSAPEGVPPGQFMANALHVALVGGLIVIALVCLAIGSRSRPR